MKENFNKSKQIIVKIHEVPLFGDVFGLTRRLPQLIKEIKELEDINIFQGFEIIKLSSRMNCIKSYQRAVIKECKRKVKNIQEFIRDLEERVTATMRDYTNKNQVSLTKYKAIYDRLVGFINRALTSSLNLTLSNSLSFLETFFKNHE